MLLRFNISSVLLDQWTYIWEARQGKGFLGISQVAWLQWKFIWDVLAPSSPSFTFGGMRLGLLSCTLAHSLYWDLTDTQHSLYDLTKHILHSNGSKRSRRFVLLLQGKYLIANLKFCEPPDIWEGKGPAPPSRLFWCMLLQLLSNENCACPHLADVALDMVNVWWESPTYCYLRP